MAERTPKRRASYEAAATTPRSRAPPTATGLPAQVRVVALFDRGKERVHVNVDHLTLALQLTQTVRARGRGDALTDALNALVNEGAVQRVTEKPARLAVTDAGRKRLHEYRS
jgi:hypothetical protein